MKKSILLILLFSLLTTIVFAQSQILDSQSFKPLAQVESELRSGYSAASIITTIIHPITSINYPNNNIKLENKLKKQYDLVLVNISGLKDDKFSIYEFKKSAELIVDGNIVKCVEFYDFTISSSSYAYFNDYHFEYTSSSSAIISGYLLFPKSINGQETKSVELKFSGKKISWNLDKIIKMIEILK